MYRLNYCQPGALPPFRAFALTAREGLVALPRVSLPSVAGPGLQALPPAEVEGWPSAILNAAYGAYTMETICGTTHCDCLPDSNKKTPILCRKNAAAPRVARQWVRPRSSAMSIDVALSTRRGVGRDTYSLPKKNAATPQVARQWTCHHYIKDTYSLPQKRGCAPVPCQWTWHY